MSEVSSSWLQRFNRRIIRFSRTRAGGGTLALASFMETTIFPLMIELVAVPMMLAHRKRILQFVIIIWLGAVAGAALTYWLSFFLFDSFGQWLIEAFNYQDKYATFVTTFDKYGFWAIVVVGFTPIPFHVAMLAAGAAKYSFAYYMLAVILSRLARYSLLGLILYFYGFHVRAWQRKWRRDEARKKAQ